MRLHCYRLKYEDDTTHYLIGLRSEDIRERLLGSTTIFLDQDMYDISQGSRSKKWTGRLIDSGGFYTALCLSIKKSTLLECLVDTGFSKERIIKAFQSKYYKERAMITKGLTHNLKRINKLLKMLDSWRKK